MPFMFLLLIFVIGAVAWGSFRNNLRGVDKTKLLVCNAAGHPLLGP
ncbi:MAG: hypothetical protein HYU77_13950 [Betaproteobacteria bacterium]|nr:hypothetical protein [Betaproteobacteria bacterium]